MKSLQHANNQFNLYLFKTLQTSSKDKNTFLSAISIQASLAMAYVGAKDKTAESMRAVLAWGNFDEGHIHKLFQEYFSRLREGNKLYDLSVVNRMYIEKTFGITDSFRQVTEKCYFAEPVLANFKEQSEIERVKINEWVAQQTQNKIRELLVSDILNPDSRMVLINAVYFNGKWNCPFLANDTTMRPFKVRPGLTVNVPTMNGTYVYGFTTDAHLGCTVLELTYKGNDLSMVIILPDEDFGLEALLQKLDVEKLDRLLTNVRRESNTITLSLPKFEVTSEFALKHPLSEMGMADAFSTSANFSGISSENTGLRLSDVIHKSYLKVDEKGTEAATATATIMIPECDVESEQLSINHPFLFAVVDRRFTNLLMFWGQIIDPRI